LIEFPEGCIRFQIDLGSPNKGKSRFYYADFYDAVLGKRFDSTLKTDRLYVEELYRLFVVLGASTKSSQVSQTNIPSSKTNPQWNLHLVLFHQSILLGSSSQKLSPATILSSSTQARQSYAHKLCRSFSEDLSGRSIWTDDLKAELLVVTGAFVRMSEVDLI
jgi:hypothetical protein